MRLFTCLAPALAGVAAAATADQQQPAEAYILRSKLPAPDAAVSLQSEVAEAVLLQRLCSNVRSYPLGELPQSVSMDDAVTIINQLGKPVQPLFQEPATEPHQLVIEFSGVTADNYKAIKAAIPRVPLAFTSDHTVSPRAAANTKKCAFGPSISTSRAECWEGNTQYLRYDAVKDAAIIKQLAINLGQLKSAALSGQMETIFLINGPVSHAQRRAEKPMTDTAFLFDPANPGATGASMIGVDSPEPAAESSSAPRPTGPIQACFKTEDACNKGTGNCSGHGKCTAKYPGEAAECYSCKCHTTNEDNGNGGTSVYHWGGKACQKIDVSVPFWLFLGTGVILAGMVGMCITLLYNVGEEPLPGVIGAGVSRSGSK